MKDLLRISDLSSADLMHLLLLSEQVRQDPHARPDLLGGDTVITYFAKPSTRTRLSFGSAISHLGGVPEIVGPTELQLGRGETIEDTARVVSRYARAFVIRTFADDDVRRFAAAATIPVINALTDLHHPCQALADLLTLRQHFGAAPRPKLAYLGDGNNVAHSLMEACALAGIDIAVATPVGYEPDAGIADAASERGRPVRRDRPGHPRPARGGGQRQRRLHRRLAVDGRQRGRAGRSARRRSGPTRSTRP